MLQFLSHETDIGFPFSNSTSESLVELPDFSSLGLCSLQHRDCLKVGTMWLLDKSHAFHQPRTDVLERPPLNASETGIRLEGGHGYLALIRRNQAEIVDKAISLLIREHASPVGMLTMTGGIRGMLVLGVTPQGICWCGHSVRDIVSVVCLNYCLQTDVLSMTLKFPLHSDGDLSGPGGSDDGPTEAIVMIADSTQSRTGKAWLAGRD